MRSRSIVLGRHLLPAVLAVMFVLPLIAMVIGSLRPVGAAPPTGIELLPSGITSESFRRLSTLLPIGIYLRNSVVVTVLAVPLTVLVTSLAGFGIRLLDGKAKRAVILGSILIMLVPTSALWITRFRVYAGLGLIGSVLPLVAPALLGTTPLLVLIYAWSFHGISDSQLAAARLEGATPATVWWRIAVPQVRSATLAVSVLAFTFHWGNFIDALLYLRGQRNFTLPLGLDTLKLLRPTEFPLLMAGAVVFTLPSIGVFLLANRLFTDDPAAALRGDH
ncbi:MAG: carbohydrate ABC transporter permease [Euzebya sp.]